MTLRQFFEDIYLDIALVIMAFIYVGYDWKSDLPHILGMVMSLISFVFWIVSRFNLGKSFAMKAEAKQLVTHGVYSKIRHPMYIFSALVVLGIVIALNHVYLYSLFLLLLIIQIARIKNEEKRLQEEFGQEYLKYKSQTWF